MTRSEDGERRQMLEEIGRLVAEAKGSGTTLRAGHHAALLFAAHPAATFSIGHIIDAITQAAAKAGVPVEASRTE